MALVVHPNRAIFDVYGYSSNNSADLFILAILGACLHYPNSHRLLPDAGSLEYPKDVRTGFKQQYAPEGASGCAIGFSRTGCAFPGGGSLALPEYTGYQLQASEYRIFIPAGTKSFMFSGYAPQRAVAAFVLRYGAPPSRTAGMSGAEY